MQSILEIFNQYARSELMILVPVLFLLSKIIHKSKVKDEKIPVIISIISVTLCGIYTFAVVPVLNWQSILLEVFTSVTQGVLFAGASIFGGILINPSCIIKVLEEKSKSNKKD